MCAFAYARVLSKERKTKLGKLHVARYLVCPSLSLFSRYASPRPRQGTCTAFPCSSNSYLPVCFFFLSLSRHCEAREGSLVLRGGRQGRQMSFQTSLPRLLCVSCGSGVRFWKHMHMREAGEGRV